MNISIDSHLYTDPRRIEIAKRFVKELASIDIPTQKILQDLKSKYSSHYKISFLKNSELVEAYKQLLEGDVIPEDHQLEMIIRRNKTRTLSGVTPVALLMRPGGCDAQCVYCPSEAKMPKSYLSNEPAVMRAQRNNWEAKAQVQMRIKALENTGHPAQKIELIVMGGTFSYYPIKYQEDYIKGAFDALNRCESESLEQAQEINETAHHRCVALNIETRPDYIDTQEIQRLRRYGVTRVEMGVQSIYDDVQKLTKRGHYNAQTVQATRLLKDAGLKVSYHLMPNLPGSDFDRDVEMIQKIFGESEHQPDQIKLYPCMVTRHSELEKWYNEGKHKAYDNKELLDLMRAIKKHIPRYVRISRLYRDIPANQIVSGCTLTNFREVLHKEMDKHDEKCLCTRCREVRHNYDPNAPLSLSRINYDASWGHEIFLSYTDEQTDTLYALLRLRIPSQYFTKEPHFIEELQNAAIIREVHSYGSEISLGKSQNKAAQHKGLGKQLIKEAERIAKEEYNLHKISVISGIGVKKYYEKLGYTKDGSYMGKKIHFES